MAQPSQPRDRGGFEIAIICALQSEADAVEALFDRFWGDDGEMYGKAPGDLNAYTMGVIGLHNVVLAHMPGMGKGNAAAVSSSFGVSFPGIKLALVIGICGGVPHSTDGEEILLGDVVISDGLVEYDFGRRYPDKFLRKNTLHDSPGRPNLEIRSLLGKLKGFRSGKRLRNNTYHYLVDLQGTLGMSNAQYPGVGIDRLFEATYRHKHHELAACTVCSKCENKEDEVCQTALDSSCSDLMCHEDKELPRSRLSEARQTAQTNEPMIHFGLIASGDTVMKSGEDRDAIAAQEGVIAFEMEGAGIWDRFPCLVIKGVCDYADSHKNKSWQNYAVAAAASCMKAFLREWIPVDLPGEARAPTDGIIPIRPTEVSKKSTDPEGNVRECLRSLSFANIDDRQASIAWPHQDTCNWLFETWQFQVWRDRTDLPTHNGILWIKGKPGAGKSTLMNHTLRYCKETFQDRVIAAYFFNARGNILEKSPLGMLRSLLYQLLDQDIHSSQRFLPVFLDKQKKHGTQWEWHIGELKSFLLSEMTRHQYKPLIVLIDALDECNETEAREVISFLESLSTNAVHAKVILNICLSSRYYPYISIERGLELMVENQKEHDRDIAKYVQHNLRVQNIGIETEILRKGEHIFMWVVLVVKMLNIAFDEGDIGALQNKLREVPSDLNKVFSILLGNDELPKRRRTILMFQWVLFAERLLKPEELYFAVLAGTEKERLGPWNREHDTLETIKRFITSTSMGLIEVRKGNGETVQFIHESVNDFLLRHKKLQTLDPTLELHTVGNSHDRLATCCMSYVMMEEMKPISNMSYHELENLRSELVFNYPFLLYASSNCLYHADKAQQGGVMQQALVQLLQHRPRNLLFLIDDKLFKEADTDANLLYIVSYGGNSELAKNLLFEDEVNVNAQVGYYGTALQAASVSGIEAVVSLLLGKGADVNTQGGFYGTALQAASVSGRKAVVKLLLEKGADVNTQGGYYGTALQAASVSGRKAVVKLLLEKGADVNTQGGFYGTALQAASVSGRKAVVKLLLEKGADVNTQGGYYGTALQAASGCGREAVMKLLLEKGADVNTQGGYYGTALQAASASGIEAVVSLLLEKGADVNTQGGYYGTALQAASVSRIEAVVSLLLEKGADVNTQGGFYGTALQAASASGIEAVVSLLLEKGADVNTQGGFYGTALQAASGSGRNAVVKLLLEKGADVNIQGGHYGNALQAASEEGHKTIVNLLLKAGAAPLSQKNSIDENIPTKRT